MRAELIFTGSEILMGHILNSHSQYLGKRLSEIGIDVAYHITVGDDRKRIEQVIRQAIDRCDLIITTGGLGPTTDDLTSEALASVLGVPMVLDQLSMDKIKDTFEKRGMKLTHSVSKEACLPDGSVVLANTRGTAPGALIEKDSKIIVMLPGPPNELTEMFETSVVPYLKKKAVSGAVTRYKVYKLTGISESAVQDLLADLGGQGNPGIAYVAKPGEMQVRISAYAGSSEKAEKMLSSFSDKVRCRLEENLIGCDQEVLEEVVGKLMIEKGLTIGLAESCTGGLIAAKLTDIPGSSRYFRGGIVSYSNEMKIKSLGVSALTIEQYSEYSEETAVAMAEGIRILAGTDLGLATTGIAGPGEITAAAPVGMVYIALATPQGTLCNKYRFPGSRMSVRQGALNAGLNMVRRYLLARK